MANVFSPDYALKRGHFCEYGNAVKDFFKFKDVAASGDKLYFGIIPAGTTITEMDLRHDADADATLSLGYEPVDSMGPTAATTYWFSAQALSAAGLKQSVSKPVTFEQPVKLVGTLGGGALPNTVEVFAVYSGRMDGVK